MEIHKPKDNTRVGLYIFRAGLHLAVLVLGFDVDMQVKVCAATFQDRVGLQNLLLYPGVLTTDGCQELKDQFGAFSLSCSRLTTEHKHTHRHKNTQINSFI